MSIEKATLGAGCFWCVEAIFQRLKGVISLSSGYTGGKTENPTYKQICNGNTGHAEVIQLEFDNEVISFEEILNVFFHTHDPTTLNQQGNDVGTQYRSAIFYHDENQKNIALQVKEKCNASKEWKDPIVTEISPITVFYKAEDYHQNYYNDNTFQPYCSFVISPKLKKFEKLFADKMKK